MSEHEDRRAPLDPAARYYAVYFDDSKTRIVGIRRRFLSADMRRLKLDEAFTRNLKWESTLFFLDEKFGRGSEMPYEEVGLEEAERIVSMLCDYWTQPRSTGDLGPY